MDRLRDLDAWKGALDGEHKISLMAQTIASLVLLIAITVKVDADRDNWGYTVAVSLVAGFMSVFAFIVAKCKGEDAEQKSLFSVPIVGDITTNRLLATFLCICGASPPTSSLSVGLPRHEQRAWRCGAASWPAWLAHAAFTETTLKCSKALLGLGGAPSRRLALVLPSELVEIDCHV